MARTYLKICFRHLGSRSVSPPSQGGEGEVEALAGRHSPCSADMSKNGNSHLRSQTLCPRSVDPDGGFVIREVSTTRNNRIAWWPVPTDVELPIEAMRNGS